MRCIQCNRLFTDDVCNHMLECSAYGRGTNLCVECVEFNDPVGFHSGSYSRRLSVVPSC